MNKEPMRFEGLDHVVFNTSDMHRAVEFYNGLLGMPILHAMELKEVDDDGNETVVAQHYFFGVGGENPEAHIGIFGWKNTRSVSGVAPPKSPGGFSHLNLKIDADRIEDYCDRLLEAKVDFTHITRYLFKLGEPLPHPKEQPEHNRTWRIKKSNNEYHEPAEGWLMSSVYLTDPDGVRIEFNSFAPNWPGMFPASDVTPRGSTLTTGV